MTTTATQESAFTATVDAATQQSMPTLVPCASARPRVERATALAISRLNKSIMDLRFDGKHALVTGAGKGIGNAIAKALAAGGAETIALSRSQEDLDHLKAENPEITTVCVDLSDWAAARKAVEEIGPVDLLVVARGMVDRGKGGAIVNISSIGSHTALPLHTAICASKGALDQVTRVMALELGPHQVNQQIFLIEGHTFYSNAGAYTNTSGSH
ncbi:L-xylulose reductase [Lamellibrachia satsuma]|nr:L-xylulose reductase [Lamellibrachia satsuma]